MKDVKSVIEEKGIRISWVAEQLGVSREGFYQKLNNNTEFKASEIAKLVKILHLNDKEIRDIFFAQYGE